MLVVKAVFFDMGGTLIRDDPPVPVVFTRVAQRRGHEVRLSDAQDCMPQVDEYYQAEYLRDGDFWCSHDRAVQIWLDMYSLMAKHCGISDEGLPQAVYDEYLLAENWSLFPDAASCLKELKARGIALAAVSNWDATLEGLLRKMGVLPYFDEVVASAAVGYRKPSSVIFEIALERLGIRANESVHVGDLPDADGDGATGAGIRPVIIDRKGTHAQCKYDRIATLEDLPALIDSFA